MKGLLFLCLLLLGALAQANKLAELVQKVRESETETAVAEETPSEEIASLLQVGEGKIIATAQLDPKYSLKPTILGGKGMVIDRPFKPKKVTRAQLQALQQQDRLSFERAKWVTRRMKKILGDGIKMRKVNIHSGGVAKIIGQDKKNKGKAAIAPNDKYVEADVIGYTPRRPVPVPEASKYVQPEMAKSAFRKEVKAGSKAAPGKFGLKPQKWNKPRYDVKRRVVKRCFKTKSGRVACRLFTVRGKKAQRRYVPVRQGVAPRRVNKKAGDVVKKCFKTKSGKIACRLFRRRSAKKAATPSWNAALKSAVNKVQKIAKVPAAKKAVAKPAAAKPAAKKAAGKAPRRHRVRGRRHRKVRVPRNLPLTKRIAKAVAGRKAPRVDWRSPSLAKKLVQVLNKLAMQDANEDVIANEQAQLLKLAATKAAEASAFGPALLNGQEAQNKKVMDKLEKFERALRFLVEKVATDDILNKANTKREAAMNNKIDRLIKAVRYLVAKSAGVRRSRRAGAKPAAKAVKPRAARPARAAAPKKVVAARPAAKPAAGKTLKPKRHSNRPLRPRNMRFAEFNLDEAVNEEFHSFMADADAAAEEAMNFAAEDDAAAEEQEETDAAEDESEEAEEQAAEEEEQAAEEEEQEESEEESDETDEESFLEVAEEEQEEDEEEEEAEEETEEEEAEEETEEEEVEEEEEADESFLEVSGESEEEEEEEEEESEGPNMFYAKIEENNDEEEGDVVGGPQRSEEEMEAMNEDEDVVVHLAEKNAEGAFIETEEEAEEEEEESEEAEEEEEEEESEEAEEEETEEEEEAEEESEEEEEETEEAESEEATEAVLADTGDSFIDNNQQVKDLRSAIESIQAELTRVKAEGDSLRA